jgi:hypothetical protein
MRKKAFTVSATTALSMIASMPPASAATVKESNPQAVQQVTGMSQSACKAHGGTSWSKANGGTCANQYFELTQIRGLSAAVCNSLGGVRWSAADSGTCTFLTVNECQTPRKGWVIKSVVATAEGGKWYSCAAASVGTIGCSGSVSGSNTWTITAGVEVSVSLFDKMLGVSGSVSGSHAWQSSYTHAVTFSYTIPNNGGEHTVQYQRVFWANTVALYTTDTLNDAPKVAVSTIERFIYLNYRVVPGLAHTPPDPGYVPVK